MLNIGTHNRFESVRKRRRGFAIGLIMIGAVVAIGAMVSLVVQFSDLLSDSIIYLTTEIPRFDYRVVDQETGMLHLSNTPRKKLKKTSVSVSDMD